MRQIKRIKLSETINNQLIAKKTQKFNLSSEERNTIEFSLLTSQKKLCSYCECRIDKIEGVKNYHIEHFYEQKTHKNQIYFYENLLLSCQGDVEPLLRKETKEQKRKRRTNISCGHKKSYHKKPLDYDLMLNPADNNSHLFSYKDGFVKPNPNSTKSEKEKVIYTIKRLNLDSDKLNNRRIDMLLIVFQCLEDIKGEDRTTFVKNLLDETNDILTPYFSTIKDNFSLTQNM